MLEINIQIDLTIGKTIVIFRMEVWKMFDKKKYTTRTIAKTVDIRIQMFLWNLINKIDGEIDYFQIFKIEKNKDNIRIIHKQEEPEYEREYILNTEYILKSYYDPNFSDDEFDDDYYDNDSNEEFSRTIYAIDDGEYATMLYAEEY